MQDELRAVLRDKGHEVVSVSPDATVLDAVRKMNEAGTGSVLVLDGQHIAGIFTERDVLRRVVDAGRSADDTRVRDVMTERLVIVAPDNTVTEAMAIMTVKRCRHLPVLEDRRLVGLISIGDLTRWVSRRQQIHLVDLEDYITGRYPR